jgi:hypothetical protein
VKTRLSSVRFAATVSRAGRTSTLSLFLALFATGSAFALGTPEQRKACTPTSTAFAPARSPTTSNLAVLRGSGLQSAPTSRFPKRQQRNTIEASR